MLIDLTTKDVTGKAAEAILGMADITVNKNMVPFDTRSPFVTSGIRLGTAAITTRGINESEIVTIAEFIDEAIINRDNEAKLRDVKANVNELMSGRPLFATGVTA
jgi:glycine hydroxymethyltransferase